MKIRFGISILVFISSLQLRAQSLDFIEVSATNSELFFAQEAKGVSVADFDNDGDDDFFIAANPSRLFRNDGNFQFTEIALSAGVQVNGKLAVWFDADNDGWLDLLVSSYNRLHLFHNNGNGTFTQVPVPGFKGTKSQVALMVGDLNGDGWPDVYTNNFKIDNQLFINYGGNQFRDRIRGSGAEINDQSMAGILYDFDNDQDLDLYITFDGYRSNKLFINDGEGFFYDAAATYNLNIRTQGMGVDIADFNRDGVYDIYVANLFENSLLLSNSSGSFDEVGGIARVDDFGMGWGTVAFDYDNDGYSDIYVNNEYNFSPFSNKLYRNNGDGTFTNVAEGSPLENKRNGFGCATGDFDGDGRIDLVLVNTNQPGIRLFRNVHSSSNNWIALTLVGITSNKFAIGSRVILFSNGTTFMEDISVGSGWFSQNSYTVTLGIGDASVIDSVKIVWPDGQMEIHKNIAINKRHLIVQSELPTDFNATAYLKSLSKQSTLPIFDNIPDDQNLDLADISIARLWNEALLDAIRNDAARPTVHARNLFHISAAMYDAWAAIEHPKGLYYLGNQVGNVFIPFEGFSVVGDRELALQEAISYAAYRLIRHRFKNSPGADVTLGLTSKLFQTLGYNEAFTSNDYSTGSPAALGNYIAEQVIQWAHQDGSNEENDYANLYYKPVNAPLRPELPGNPSQRYPNRWQPLQLQTFIDQNGIELGNMPPFLSPEWGKVVPFALKDEDLSIVKRGGNDYWLFHDTGQPPRLDTLHQTPESEEFQKSFLMVSTWSSHLDPKDGVNIDISPSTIGNLKSIPTSFTGHLNYYKFFDGGDLSIGHVINPKTNLPYGKQIVPRGDYTRVLAEFWADGPRSETPPGHWFTILNYVSYSPVFQRKLEGTGPKLSALEWDTKSYFALGGALHDAAISAWSIKGFYDYTRPISALRYMAEKGQSTSPELPRYHPAGMPLVEGFSELVNVGDPLAGPAGENLNKIKLYTWRGHSFIDNPVFDAAGVGWILAENWWPYQRPTFVTPPFAGYISGHSTFSSTAAALLALLTGDEYFPGGMGEFLAKKDQYLVFERGPSVDVRLQWATYKDAADQCSLSRIWGGIHPPLDDFPGRVIGKEIGNDAFKLARQYFRGLTIGEMLTPSEVDLFPNPIIRGSDITIKTEAGITGIQFFDALGRSIASPGVVKRSVLTATLGPVEYISGVYLVRVATQKGVQTKKLLIVE